MNHLPEHLAADETIYAAGEPSPDEPPVKDDEAVRAEQLEHTYHGMTLPKEEDAAVGAPGCQHCEMTPATIRGPGVLQLQFPHTHTLGKALSFLIESPWTFSELDGIVSVDIPEGSLAPLLSPMLETMSSIEQRDSKAVFKPDGEIATEENSFKIDALPKFLAKTRSEWLLDILREKRLYSVFQPIVQCTNGECDAADEIYGYECLMRATVGGKPAAPNAMIEMARNAGLLFQLDLAARRAAITGAAEHQIKQKIFVNFSPNSIYNPYSCLRSTVGMIDELGIPHEQVVFEIVESERLPEMKHLKRIVEFYRENGFGVALDDVGAGFSSLNVLVALRPDYVKLDMFLMRNVHQDAGKALVARKLIETARELELKTIAEGIETAEELEWVKQHGADFVQGYYFARPAVPPPHLFDTLKQSSVEYSVV